MWYAHGVRAYTACRKEEYTMEKYTKPVMVLEEIEDEVYTAVDYAAVVVSGDITTGNNLYPRN